jgi:hypothetical protein
MVLEISSMAPEASCAVELTFLDACIIEKDKVKKLSIKFLMSLNTTFTPDATPPKT